MKKNRFSRFMPLFISSVIAASLFVTVSAAPGGTPPTGNVDANFNSVTAVRGALGGLEIRKTETNNNPAVRVHNTTNQGYGVSSYGEGTAGHFENMLPAHNRAYLGTPDDAINAVGRIRALSETTAGHFENSLAPNNRVYLGTATEAISTVGRIYSRAQTGAEAGRFETNVPYINNRVLLATPSAAIEATGSVRVIGHVPSRNTVDLGTSNYAIDARGNVSVNGHLQATSIGSYVTRTSNFSVPSGAGITYSQSTPCQSNEQVIACGYDMPRSTPFDEFHLLGQRVNGNQCTTNAYNFSGRTITITTSVTCFNPSS